MAGLGNCRFGRAVADKSVAGCNLPGNRLDATGRAGIQRTLDQRRVAGEFLQKRRALDNAIGIGIMIDNELADTDIPNSDLCRHIARHAGEDDLFSTVAGDEELGGGGGVRLAHAGAANHKLFARQHPLVVGHPGVSFSGAVGQFGAEQLHFGGHCAQNADCHGSSPFLC